jgi:hypothetical protein
VSVGKNDGVDFGRVDAKGVPVLEPQLFETLKHAAVNHYFGVATG